MIFAPLGGTDQSFLLSVPACDHDSALGLPAGFQERPQTMYRLQHRRSAAIWIYRAVHPGIAMIAGDHPFIGRRRSANFADYIPNRAELVVLLKVHLHVRGAGSNVVSKRQRSLPLTRRLRAAKVLKNRRGIGVGEWSYRNLRHLLGLRWRYAFRIRQPRSGRHSRRGGVSGKLEHKSDGPALHTGGRAPRSLRIGVAAVVTIIFWIRIDDDSSGAAFLRHKRLHAAKILAVTDDHDFSAHIDIHLLQLVEVGGRSIVRIDNFRLGIARGRHATVRSHHPRIVL